MRFTLKRFNAGLLAAFVAGLALLAAALPSAAAADNLAPAVEGGSNAIQGQAPWSSVALITAQLPGGEIMICSGTVVATDMVLTAGHCAVDQATNQPYAAAAYTVMTGSVTWQTDPAFGDFTAGPGGTLSSVTQVIPDPSFAWTYSVADHDAALLVLATPTSAPVMQLATPADASLYTADSTVRAAGWGKESPNATDVPPNLQWVSTTLESQSFCQAEDGPYWDANDQVCTSSGTSAGTCEGDSGGPVVATGSGGNAVEIGITSYGPAGACNLTYQVNVSAISLWLDQEIGLSSPLTAVTDPPIGVTRTAAVLNGSAKELAPGATYYFQYGQTTSYGGITPTEAAATGSEFSASISDLLPGTSYHYRLVITEANGVVYGADRMFTTVAEVKHVVAKIVVEKPRAGTYRGSTSQHDKITLKVAANRNVVTGISLKAGLRCTKLRRASTYTLALQGSHRLTTHHGLGLSSSFVIKHDWHYHVTATFTKTGNVAGTISVTADHQPHGTCRSGTLHWTAKV